MADDIQQLKQWLDDVYQAVGEAHHYAHDNDFESALLSWESVKKLAPRIRLKLSVLASQQLLHEQLSAHS